jgi:hypothetical protein
LPAEPSSYGNALDEWKEVRSILARKDENIHDLRKYGFSFVTAILAAEGLLSQGGVSIPDGVKAGVLLVTMGLIVTLKLLDTHYRRFQRAASIRGRIIEDRLNLNLTNDISFFYNLQRWWRYMQALYYGFMVLTALLGFAILWNNSFFAIIIFIAALLSGMLIHFIDAEKQDCMTLEDWSVDMKIVPAGLPVRITYTNLNPQDRKEQSEYFIGWNVMKTSMNAYDSVENRPEVEELPKNSRGKATVRLKYFENYDWLWETTNVKPGLYELEMYSQLLGNQQIKNEAKNQNRTELRKISTTIQVISL